MAAVTAVALRRPVRECPFTILRARLGGTCLALAHGRSGPVSRRRGAMQKRVTAATLTLLTLIGLGTGCRAMTGRSLGTNIDDLTTTAQVKTRLSVTNIRNSTWV